MVNNLSGDWPLATAQAGRVRWVGVSEGTHLIILLQHQRQQRLLKLVRVRCFQPAIRAVLVRLRHPNLHVTEIVVVAVREKVATPQPARAQATPVRW
jgi:hypothetical protein